MLNKVYRDERERVTRELADAFTKKILSAPGKVPTKLDETWSAGSPAPHLYAIAGDLLSLNRGEEVEALASHHRMPQLLGMIDQGTHQAADQAPGMMMVGGGMGNVHLFGTEDPGTGRSRSSSASSAVAVV